MAATSAYKPREPAPRLRYQCETKPVAPHHFSREHYEVLVPCAKAPTSMGCTLLDLGAWTLSAHWKPADSHWLKMSYNFLLLQGNLKPSRSTLYQSLALIGFVRQSAN